MDYLMAIIEAKKKDSKWNEIYSGPKNKG